MKIASFFSVLMVVISAGYPPGVPCEIESSYCPVAKCAAGLPGCKMVKELVGTSSGTCCPKLCNWVCPSENITDVDPRWIMSKPAKVRSHN